MATQMSNFGLIFEQVTGSAPGNDANAAQLYASSSTNEGGTTQLFMKDSAGNEVPLGGSFKLEDGDGTELAISGGAQMKFIDGGGTNGLDINWSDVSHGIDGDEYDLEFKVDIVNLAPSTGVDDADLVMIDDGAGGTLRKMTRAHFIESAALDNINIDGGAIDGTPIGANSAAAGTFAAIVGTSAVVNGNAAVSGTLHVTGNSQLQGTLEAKGAASFEAAITAQNNLTVSGQTDLNGDINLGNASGDTVTVVGQFDSDLVPSSDGARDLGSSTKEWKDLYIDGVAYVDSLQADQLGAALDANSQAITNINVDSGAIDGAVIGANNAAAGTFAAMVATSAVVNGNSALSGTLHVTGNSQLQGTLEAKGAASFEAAITAQDALSVAGKLSGSNGIYISGDSSLENVLVRGDLDVQGAINTITNHETELHIADKVILIASGTSKNDGAAALGALDGGGIYLGSTGSLAVASLRWDAGNDRWHTDESMHVSGAMNVGDSAVFSNDVAITGTLSAQGVVSFNGDVNLGDAASDTVTVTGQFDSDLVPSTDGARDLGSSTKEWKDLYIDGVAYVDTLNADALGANLDHANFNSTNVDIDSGAIDGTVIGANSAAAGTFAAMIATSAVVNGNSALSGTLHVTGNSQLQGTLEAKGAASFEAAITAQDALSVAGKLSGSNGLRIQGDAQFDDVLIGDDKKLAFGAGSDASFEYDEDDQNVLLYAGASMRFSDDVKLEFGAAGDASIEYDEDGTDQLRIAAPAAGVVIAGAAPSLTIGDADAEDTKLVFDGNAADFYMGLDDTDDKLKLGLGSTVGTTPNMSLASANRNVQFHGNVQVDGNNLADNAGNAVVSFDGSGNGGFNANMTVGGGYGSTGVTISSGGAIQANSSLTVDEGATFGGGYGSTGVTISNAGALSANGMISVGSDGAGANFKAHGAAANEFMSYDKDTNLLQLNGSDGNTIVSIGGDDAGEYAIDVPTGATNKHKIRASAFVTYSDESLKQDVASMSNTALDTVMSLEGVEFTWKDSGERDFGFIAQDVQSVLPKAVHTADDGVQGVDYSRLTSVLVEAVKAQQVQIEDLKKVISNLKK
jgi:hypothetical protein